LPLLARERLEAEEGFLVRPRANGVNETADLHDAAGEAAGANHLEQPRGAKPWVLLERLEDESCSQESESARFKGTEPGCDDDFLLDVPSGSLGFLSGRRVLRSLTYRQTTLDSLWPCPHFTATDARLSEQS
jgi:hypothetical protein